MLPKRHKVAEKLPSNLWIGLVVTQACNWEFSRAGGPIPEKGTPSCLKEDTACAYCFLDPLVEENCGRSLIWLL